MKLAIMQPYFLPYIGYFQAINEVDKYILYENLSFIKDAWMNRNNLMLNSGLLSMFSVPLLAKTSNEYIRNIKIDNSKKWSEKILKTILFNYKKSAFFDETYPLMEELLQENHEYLYQLNAFTIISISEYLDIQTEIVFDNKKYLVVEEQLRKIEQNDFSAFPYLNKTKPDKKTARVIVMCKMEGANLFINAIGGQDLYSKEEFAQYDIDLKFIKMDSDIDYSQFSKEFIKNLSIIDVLMHNGKEGTKQLLKRYTLI